MIMSSLIVDDLFCAGSLVMSSSIEHPYYLVNNYYNIGYYKRVFFPFDRSLGKKKSKVILFLAWFHDDSPSPILSTEFIESYFKYVSAVADRYPDYQIFIRPKDISRFDKILWNNLIDGKYNVYLQDDFSTEAISYSLCFEADLIISIPTSLAEESISIGKKVIFLDNFLTIKHVSSSTYPKEYYDFIASDFDDLLFKASLFLNDDTNYLSLHENLKNQLTGDFDMRNKGDISILIENFLV